MNKNKTLKLALTGVMAALTFVATIVVHIPMPSTEGYVNVGDTIIFVCAALFGGIPAAAAGAIGSAIADLIYAPEWALFTILIKGTEGFLCGVLIKAFSKINKYASVFLAMFISALWMIGAYYLAGAVLYGFAGSLASVPGNVFQGGVCIAIGYVIWLTLYKIKSLQVFIERINN